MVSAETAPGAPPAASGQLSSPGGAPVRLSSRSLYQPLESRSAPQRRERGINAEPAATEERGHFQQLLDLGLRSVEPTGNRVHPGELELVVDAAVLIVLGTGQSAALPCR